MHNPPTPFRSSTGQNTTNKTPVTSTVPPRSGNSGGGATHSSTSALGVVNDVQRGNENEFRGNEKRQISKGQRPQRLLANLFCLFFKGNMFNI